MTVGGHKKGDMTDLGNNCEMSNCAEASFPSGMKAGYKWDTLINSWKLTNNVHTAYFNYAKNGRTAGARIDHSNGKFETKVGLQLEQEDHTWKFRFHHTGMMHTMLKWRLHKTCSAMVNTSLDLKDVPKGKINSVPVGLSFHIEC